MIRLDTTEFIKLVPSATNLDEVRPKLPFEYLCSKIDCITGSSYANRHIWGVIVGCIYTIHSSTRIAK